MRQFDLNLDAAGFLGMTYMQRVFGLTEPETLLKASVVAATFMHHYQKGRTLAIENPETKVWYPAPKPACAPPASPYLFTGVIQVEDSPEFNARHAELLAFWDCKDHNHLTKLSLQMCAHSNFITAICRNRLGFRRNDEPVVLV